MKVPVFYLVLDAVGMLLVVLAVLALNGVDIGLPGLVGAAPWMIPVGIALMVPFLVWVLRRAIAQARERTESGR